jgi:hypothetical protein
MWLEGAILRDLRNATLLGFAAGCVVGGLIGGLLVWWML